MDLFEELAKLAAEYGWTGLGQPVRLTRRFGKAVDGKQVTLTLHANQAGTGLVHVSRDTVDEKGARSRRELGAKDAGKRDQATFWIRFAGEDRLLP